VKIAINNKPDKTTTIFLGFLLFIAYLAIGFASHSTLGTFADDSVSYIIMGQSYSPYFSTHPVIMDAAKTENYPPIFPILLALTGTSHSFLAGHVLVVILFLCSLLLFYFFSAFILNNKPTALFVSLLFAASPSTWLNMMGILSENLYILLVIATLFFYEKKIRHHAFSPNVAMVFGLLLSLVLLTRSIGISLIAAFVISSLIKEKTLAIFYQINWLITLIIPTSASLLWYFFGTHHGSDLYANDVGGVLENIMANGNIGSNVIGLIKPQLEGLYMSWYTAFLLHWRSEFEVRAIISGIFALIILAGFSVRLFKNKIDAWYTLFYLLIIIVWPYSEQTGRFLYPALPLLFLYGAVGLGLIQNTLPDIKWKSHFSQLGLLLVLATVIPTMVFFQDRAQYETEVEDMDFTRVMLFYNYPDLTEAKRIAVHHEHLRQDLEKIKQTTEKQATIMWYTPNYINLLSKRKAVRFPRAFPNTNSKTNSITNSITNNKATFFTKIKQSGADYIFAAKLNPRYTSAEFDGLAVYPLFTDITSLVWSRQNPIGIGVLSVLLKIDQKKLDAKIAQERIK